jgi:hypothetical protein
MKSSSQRGYLKKFAIIFATLLVPFLILEMGLRISNRSNPYYSTINREQYGPFTRYDSLLGWRGTPGGKFWDDAGHHSVLYVNNSRGFRDIEHDPSSNKPAIVFLGGSYPFGEFVKLDEIFVEVLGRMLPNYEIYNFAFDCYGPDQDLLLFKRWEEQYTGQIKLVILAESKEDVKRVSANTECDMMKPKFDVVGNKLVLTGVPVPMTSRWLNEKKEPAQLTRMQVWRKRIKIFLFHSYFLHALYDRIREQSMYFRNLFHKNPKVVNDDDGDSYVIRDEDLTLTSKIFEELNKTVEARGAKLVIVFVPTRADVENLSGSEPYQDKIKPICAKLGIACIDPLPDFRKSRGLTHRHLKGGHWTPFGHKVAAESIYKFLINNSGLNLQPGSMGSN